jgi:hypothetical protein
MMNDMKKVWRLMMLGYRGKRGLILFAIFAVVGLVLDILQCFIFPEDMLSGGMFAPGALFMVISPMMLVQVFNGYGIFSYSASSSKRRKLMLTYPVLYSGIITFLIYTVVVIGRTMAIRLYPEYAVDINHQLMMVSIMILLVATFCGVGYKLFWVSYIVFMLCYIQILMRVLNGMSFLTGDISSRIADVSFPTVVFIGYGSVFFGTFLNYLLTKMLYRLPVSKWAICGLRKS